MYSTLYKYWKIRCKDFLNLEKTYAGHYSYDIHGNVKTLIQQTPQLSSIGQDIKKIDYDYDLISGKVNTVKYQDGQPDAFSHHYEYDADNRLTNVYTSKYPNAKWTGIQSDPMWDQDEKLFYYLHGPMARVELGDEKVQGLDYAYTIQGWLKGCNSNNLNASNDIGQDGETSTNNLNKHIGRDAYGYSLNYFNGDYHPIGTFTAQNNFIASTTAAAYLSTDAPGLFNGNISSMVTSLTDIASGSSTLGQSIPQLTAYRYDQLNRVKQMKAYRDINLANNAWGNGSTYDGSYETHLSYDANGNILTMQRNGVAGVNVNMDNLNYIYETTANGYAKNTNKLRHVNDNTSYTNNYQTDIDDQGTFSTGNENYDYDEIGQQKQDKSEGIASQEWNVYGKVKSITRYNGSTKPDLEFNYNTSGQRISKIVKPRDANGQRPMIEWITTYYIKDVQGNTLAVYEQSNDPQTQTASFKLKERYMYGDNRLGADKTEVEMIGAPAPGNNFSRTLGNKTFDLTNQRGDVITSVSDRKIGIEDPLNLGTVAYYKSEIITTSETYLFGQPMPGRNIGLSNERHGYQGQEKVDEVNGKPGTHYTAEYWEYNALTGRRENRDPKPNPSISDYATFANNPIWYSDPLGDIVDYKRFRDKVNVGVKRLFDKDFRDDFNKKRDDQQNTFTYDKVAGAPTLGNANTTFNGLKPVPFVGSEYDVKYSSNMDNGVLRIGAAIAISPLKITLGTITGLGIGIHNIFSKNDIGWGWGNRVETTGGINALSFGFGDFNNYNMIGGQLGNLTGKRIPLRPKDGLFGVRVGVGKLGTPNFIDVFGEIRDRANTRHHFHINIASEATRNKQLSHEEVIDTKE